MTSPLAVELEKLGKDRDFQDDLRHPIVQEAILHWIGWKRLSPEEADDKFMENYRVVAVLQKFLRIQELCKRENAPFPIQLFLKGEVGNEGEEYAESVIKVSAQPAKWSVVAEDSTRAKGETSSSNDKADDSPEKERERVDEGDDEEDVADKMEDAEREDDPLAEFGLMGKLLSMKGNNVARCWSIQFALIAAFLAHLMTISSAAEDKFDS